MRRLLHSITSNNAAILPAKTTILADYTRVNNFELAAVFLILTVTEPPAGGGRDHRVSAFQHGKLKKWASARTQTKTGRQMIKSKLDTIQLMNGPLLIIISAPSELGKPISVPVIHAAVASTVNIPGRRTCWSSTMPCILEQ